jgi:hypothetical protein
MWNSDESVAKRRAIPGLAQDVGFRGFWKELGIDRDMPTPGTVAANLHCVRLTHRASRLDPV